MTAMGFPAFLTLLILGLISSFVIHTLIRYRILAGWDGFLFQWVAGYIGGWVGSSVFGRWGVPVGNVTTSHMFFVPAVIGTFVGTFVAVALFKALAASGMRRGLGTEAAIGQPPVAARVEMRKVG